MVRTHRLASAVFYFTAFLATLITTAIVASQLGLFWAVIWFTVPIGSLAYLKARFSPLEPMTDRRAP